MYIQGIVCPAHACAAPPPTQRGLFQTIRTYLTQHTGRIYSIDLRMCIPHEYAGNPILVLNPENSLHIQIVPGLGGLGTVCVGFH